jgi:hypothetical protein
MPVAWPQVLDVLGTPLVIEPSPGQLSSDVGLLRVPQFDQRVGLTRAFADDLDDPRDPEPAGHSLLEMVRARVYGSLAGYGDENDHDLDGLIGTLTHHPADETGTARPR